MNLMRAIILFLWIVLCLACTSFPPPATDQAGTTRQDSFQDIPAPASPAAVQELRPANTAPQGEELFVQGLRHLANPSATLAEHDQARQAFEGVLRVYPKSPWHDAALVGLDLLGAMDAYRGKLRIEQESRAKLSADAARAAQEIEQLKKDIRTLQEKCQNELAGLQQENEQLKKDIQLLKNLEIQLDRREKQLR